MGHFIMKTYTVNSIFKLYLTSLYLGTLAAVKLEQLVSKILYKDIAKVSGGPSDLHGISLHSSVDHCDLNMYSYRLRSID